ncbi:hypothetical protein HMN09_00641900 [Mycena chlorophos]|uniref:Uncharacterized protein n=1 Tax=Mycena chlorophos TaxID=658473 RepID=A0A8H6T4R5_MYCCL|nr:hypothetical protein HMN09_00641900 [Mycena chlorophos]
MTTMATAGPSSPPVSAPPLMSTFSILPTSPSRGLKRRLGSIPLFVPAAETFKPLPYAPHAASSRNTVAERVRPATQHAASSISMDPLPTDADAVFLRYPFDALPNKESYPDGVTYTTLVEHPNWFLVPEDYISETPPTNPNPDAVSYPLCLEPPRGWCPAKKKDIKEKGPEVWPDGEQPRLRCTFCRRTYAGVNAKSMWRRHVFEKHKIAMSNRRNDLDRPRGRSSNKENKRGSNKALKKEESHDTIVDLEDTPIPNAPVIPQGEFLPALDVDFPGSPTPEPVIPPASPYNPLLTPSFRHSPPRLPSDHPWRFNSPSHPLHRSRNVSLTMLRGDSPVIQTPLIKKSLRAGLPRTLFARSKLARSPPSSVARHTRSSSAVSDAWDTDQPLSMDPFVSTWDDDDDDEDEDDKSLPSSSPLRNVANSATPAKTVGLGLLEPIALPDCPPGTMLGIDDLLQLEEDEEEEEVFVSLMCSQTSTSEDPPPLKRRRTSGEM